MNRKGFTLIELLAVIIILGVLMIIAIPSVTTYIENSRKSAYIDTAKELISGARNLANEGKLSMFDTNTMYYIPTKCVSTENGGESPYGEFKEAYVGVIYTGEGYNYYWISVDSAGQGIKEVTALKNLSTEKLESNLDHLAIRETVDTTGIGNRSNILVLNTDCKTWEDGRKTKNHITDEGEPIVIIYPEGKDKEDLVPGDLVTLAGEEFYVVSNDGTNVTLITHYNLKVGVNSTSGGTISYTYSSSDPNYGIQDSEMKGVIDFYAVNYGTVPFANTNYWSGQVGPGKKYSGSYSRGHYPYVYDENSSIYPYVQNYKNYLISKGINVKEARLISYQEVESLGCRYISKCNDAPAFISDTSYWLGSASGDSHLMIMVANERSFNANQEFVYYYFGVRPVIVI